MLRFAVCAALALAAYGTGWGKADATGEDDCLCGIQVNTRGTIENFTAEEAYLISNGAIVLVGNLDIAIDGVTLPAPNMNQDCTIACSVAP